MKKSVVITFLIFGFLNIWAQDRYFARTYTANVLSKGALDLEFWHTSRIGHLNQYYHAQDQRMEIELGIGNRVQTAFYFNRFQERFSTSANGTETSNEIGFSNEWKWRLHDQSKISPSIALYGEWGIKGGDELEIETKLILDKWIGKNLVAFNVVPEYEGTFNWKNRKLQFEKWQLPIEFVAAYMYSIKPGVGVGFELSDQNLITTRGWENSVLLGGPTINFRGSNWFVIASYLPQWVNLHKTTTFPDNKDLDDHERAEFRILLGISIIN